MFSSTFTVQKASWLSDPNKRWRAGLDKAGLQFRQRLQISNYPPQSATSTYIRTGTLAKKANFRIHEAGDSLTMFFGSTFYLPYLILDGKTRGALWPDKKQELLDYMEAGFKEGIRDYKG